MLKFYLHEAVSPLDPWGPSGALDVTNNGEATGARTNRIMDGTPGTSQAAVSITTNATTSSRSYGYRRYAIALGDNGGSIASGNWQVQVGASESNSASNMHAAETLIYIWDPRTQANTGIILASPNTLGTNEPGTTETNISTTYAGTAAATNPGDFLIVELMGFNVQSMATAYTNTVFVDGTTDGSITSNAAFVLAPVDINVDWNPPRYSLTRSDAYNQAHNW